MTPKLRSQIDDAYKRQMAELNECENTPYVQFVKSIYEVQRNFLTQLPDGFLIPFTNERR